MCVCTVMAALLLVTLYVSVSPSESLAVSGRRGRPAHALEPLAAQRHPGGDVGVAVGQPQAVLPVELIVRESTVGAGAGKADALGKMLD